MLHHMKMARDTSVTHRLCVAFSTSGTCLIAWNLDYAVLYGVVTNAELILGVPEVDDPILQTGKSQGKVGQCIMGHQEPQPDSSGKPTKKPLGPHKLSTTYSGWWTPAGACSPEAAQPHRCTGARASCDVLMTSCTPCIFTFLGSKE